MVAALAAGAGLWRTHVVKQEKLRLLLPLEPDGSMHLVRDSVARQQLDANSPLRRQANGRDLEGTYRGRSYLARTLYLNLDDHSQRPIVGLWLQTKIPVRTETRASITWNQDRRPQPEGDLAQALMNSHVVKKGAPGSYIVIRNGWLGMYGARPVMDRDVGAVFAFAGEIAERIEAANGDTDILLTEIFYTSDRAADRAWALTTLHRRNKVDCSPLLADAADCTNIEVRMAVAAITKNAKVLRRFVDDRFLRLQSRQTALRLLFSILPPEDRENALQTALQSPEVPLRIEALRECQRSGPAEALSAVDSNRLRDEGEVAEAVINAVSAQPSPASLPLLKTIAQQKELKKLRTEAFRLIGQVGSIADVAWLRGLKLRTEAIEMAVANIQSRAGGTKGELSVVEPQADQAGAVSAVYHVSGALSAPPKNP